MKRSTPPAPPGPVRDALSLLPLPLGFAVLAALLSYGVGLAGAWWAWFGLAWYGGLSAWAWVEGERGRRDPRSGPR